MSKIQNIQSILGVVPDGIWGAKSQAALEAALLEDDGWHPVLASSFADPADVRAFKRCKQNGGSDHACFAVGDNAIGLWEDSTAEGTGPSCALPPEVWQPFYHAAHNKKVVVRKGDKEVVCELKDTMPHLTAIKNGARIDLNPDAVKALGMQPPIMTNVEWRWA